MDGATFDRITRRLGAGASRRSVMGAAAKGGLAALLAALDLPGAAEAKKPCTDKKKTRCPDGCVDLDKNRKNCGKCGHECDADERCHRGKCRSGGTTCAETCAGCCDGGQCRAGDTNQFCGIGGGACDACTGIETCDSGTCVGPSCDVCPSGCPFTSVQAAIDAASAGDTVTICAGTYNGDITIGKNLTLVGQGDGTGAGDTILDGTGTGTVVTVTAGTVELRRLRITGGGGFTDGGGVNNAGTLTLSNVTVADNTASGIGGGVYTEGSLTVTSATVSGNSASDGGGIFNFRGTVTLTDSVVSGNDATVRNGGGIYHQGGQFTLNNTDVIGNSAVTEGGGIYSDRGGTVTLDAASTVTDNTAGSGGGIFNDGTVACAAQTVTGNTPDNCEDGDGTGCTTCAA